MVSALPTADSRLFHIEGGNAQVSALCKWYLTADDTHNCCRSSDRAFCNTLELWVSRAQKAVCACPGTLQGTRLECCMPHASMQLSLGLSGRMGLCPGCAEHASAVRVQGTMVRPRTGV